MAETIGEVSVVGLGQMGAALAGALAARGRSVTGWNRSPVAAPAGVTPAPSLEAALDAPVAVICVSNQEATMELLADHRPSGTLVQLSSMTSAEATALSDWAEARNVPLVGGQILSFVDEIAEGRGNIVCSGPRSAYQRCEAALRAAAGNVHYVGESAGAAASFDKAHLSFSLGVYLAFLQGAAMCARAGADLRAWCDFNLRHMGEGPMVEELSILADQVCARDYAEGLDATLTTWRDALAATVAECDALGSTPAQLSVVAGLFDQAIAAGRGEEELGVLFEFLGPERPA